EGGCLVPRGDGLQPQRVDGRVGLAVDGVWLAPPERGDRVPQVRLQGRFDGGAHVAAGDDAHQPRVPSTRPASNRSAIVRRVELGAGGTGSRRGMPREPALRYFAPGCRVVISTLSPCTRRTPRGCRSSTSESSSMPVFCSTRP